MAATLQELKDGLAALVNEVTELHTSVDAEIAQTGLVVEAVNKLIAAIGSAGNQDFAEEVTALSSALGGLQAARSKLASDNASVQTAIDSANTATEPPPAA